MNANRSKITQANTLRRAGNSLSFIAKTLNISKSTAQLWTKKVQLSPEQKNTLIANQKARFIAARKEKAHKDKESRLQNEQRIHMLSKNQIRKLSSSELFYFGLGLYWAEGFKREYSMGFVNSDPNMVHYFLSWLLALGVKDEDITARIQIHESYKNSIKTVEDYWAEQLGISTSQFQKPYFQKSKKVYEFNPEYHGLIRIRVKNARKLFVRILGWLDGLKAYRV